MKIFRSYAEKVQVVRDRERDEELAEAAAELLYAEVRGIQIPPLSDRIDGFGVDEAYQVQQKNHEHWTRNGRARVGAKVGLTNPVIQRQLGVDQPDYGILYDDMVRCDCEEIPADRTIQPKVEAEAALILGRDLKPRGEGKLITVADVIGAVDYVLPCIEVVDSRIRDWKIKIGDTIADNASSCLVVLGACPKKLEGLDLRMCGATMECAGDVLSTGAGLACLGHPLNAAVWLANAFFAKGVTLKEGDVVLTGAMGPMVPAEPGKTYEARISGLGSVRTSFAGGSD